MKTSGPKVFVPCEGTKQDLDGAKQYGTLTYVLLGRVSPLHVEEIERQADLAFDSFNPAEDFLVLSGPMAAVAIVYALAMRRFRVVKTLIFNASQSAYCPRLVGGSL